MEKGRNFRPYSTEIGLREDSDNISEYSYTVTLKCEGPD